MENYFGTSAIILTRVSTQMQSYDPQINDLKAFAKSEGYTTIHTISTKESGFIDIETKDGWKQVTEFIASNSQFRTIIVTELSRLSRKPAILYNILEYLTTNKVQLIVKDINLHLFNTNGTLNSASKVIFGIFVSFVESEMETKKERFNRAKIDLKRQGYSIGGAELFGYSRVKENGRSTYVINVDEANQIKDVFSYYAYNDVSISDLVNYSISKGYEKYLHSKRNVTKMLKEEAYTGFKVTSNRKKNPDYWNYKKEDKPKYVECNKYECKYPSIFETSEEKKLYSDVQEKLKSKNPQKDKSTVHTTLLAKLLTCPCCGRKLVGDYRKDSKGYCKNTYRCSFSKGVPTHQKCANNKSISMRLLDSSVWSVVQLEVMLRLSSKRRETDKKQILEIEEKIQRLEAANDRDLYRSKMETLFKDADRKKLYAIDDAMKNEIDVERDKKLATLRKEYASKEDAINKLISEKNELMRLSTLNLDEPKPMLLYNKVEAELLPIEKDKEKLYNYLHLLVKDVTIEHTDLKFIVLKIQLNNNVEPFSLLIDKRDSNRIKLFRVFDACNYYDITEGRITIDEALKKKLIIRNPFVDLSHLYK